MPKKAKANSDQKKARRKKKSRLNIGLREILIGAGLLLLGLIVTTCALDQITEHAKFVTVNALSIFVLVAIAIQALIYRQQREIMDKAADYTKIGERAYMGMKAAALARLEVGKNPLIQIRLVNAGRTPAWNVSVGVKMFVGNALPDEKPVVITESNVVPAGLDYTADALVPLILHTATVNAVTENRAKLFIRGVARFKDAWNDKRVFRFDLVYDPSERIFRIYKKEAVNQAAETNPPASPQTAP